MADDIEVWFNPRCSKCVGAEELLISNGVQPHLIHYLDTAPTREQIEEVIGLLGIASPREMMRMGEPVAQELGLSEASDSELIAAMVRHPVLIERPIVIRGKRAVIARPPELLLSLLGSGSNTSP